jgi:hypothetical protein
MSKPIQIIVGGPGEYDPALSTTDYLNPFLAGKEFYVLREGLGIMPYSSYQPLSAGGFRLLNDTFQEETLHVVVTADNSEATTNSTYTNGFNYSRVMNAMLSRMGFKQPTESDFAIVDAGNLQSNSGRYYNDFHALVSARNIREIQSDPNISDANFNALLESLKRASIMRSLNGVLNVSEQIERTLLYERDYNQQTNTVTNDNKFVGFEIRTPQSDEFAVQIESATLLFDGDVTFNMYLFKEGKKSPLLVREVSAIAEEQTVVNFSDIILNYIGQNTKGARFYFGYFQTDLGSVKAINEEYRNWNPQKCFGAISMYSNKTDGSYNFDRQNIYRSHDNFGINLEISTFRDHTNAVVKKAHLFDELQGLQFAYSFLEGSIYGTNSNAIERMLKDQIVKAGLQLEMQGAIAAPDSPQIEGLRLRIKREMDRVRKEFYPKVKSQSVSLC